MKTCFRCGSAQDDNAVFCNKCGTPFSNAPHPQFSQPQQPQFNQPQQTQYQQPYAQPQFAQSAPFTVPEKKASSKKLIIIISAVIAVIAITVVILFVFVFKSKKDLIVGTWQEINSNSRGSYTRFYKDGTVDLTVGTDAKGTYKVDGDKLTVTKGSKTQIYTIEELTSDKLVISLSGISFSFKKVNDDEAANSEVSQASLKTANANAKLVYVTANSEASDRIADGESVDKLVYQGSASGLSGPIGNAVKKALKENGADSGYVYIYYDPDDEDANNFAQWSENENGPVIGQFPDSPSSVDDCPSFGTFKSK